MKASVLLTFYFQSKIERNLWCPARPLRHIVLCPGGNDPRYCKIGFTYCDITYTNAHTQKHTHRCYIGQCWKMDDTRFFFMTLNGVPHHLLKQNWCHMWRRADTHVGLGQWHFRHAFVYCKVFFAVVWLCRTISPFPLSFPTHTLFPWYLYVQRKAFM